MVTSMLVRPKNDSYANGELGNQDSSSNAYAGQDSLQDAVQLNSDNEPLVAYQSSRTGNQFV